MWDVILDAVLDTLKLVPLLLLVHVLIEVLEHNAIGKIKMSRALKGGLAPLIGTGVGLLPQCGFSVVAAKLYAKKHITLGALLAVFIATSDEAIPILLASPASALKLLPLLGVKLVAALVAGYGAYAVLYRKEKKRIRDFAEGETVEVKGCHGHALGGHDDGFEESVAKFERQSLAAERTEEHAHAEHVHAGESRIDADAQAESLANAPSVAAGTAAQIKRHRREHALQTVERYVWHPLLHTLTVTLYVFIVNLALGLVIFGVENAFGEGALGAFMEKSRLLQPLFSALVGLIPNCASSVAITGLYASGALRLGGAVAGLCVNAGLGLAVLFKENKNFKENVSIVAILFLFSVALGTGIELVAGLLP